MSQLPVPIRFFNEIGIIEQLSRNLLERHLPDGMTYAQVSLLMHLSHQPPDAAQTPARLASAMQVTKGAMTNTLQRLDARGLIHIRPDPTDGRGKRVTVSEAGRAVMPSVFGRLQPAVAAFLQEIDAAELEALLPALEAVRTVLDRDDFRAMARGAEQSDPGAV